MNRSGDAYENKHPKEIPQEINVSIIAHGSSQRRKGAKVQPIKNKHNDQRMTPYGITVAQLDTLILEMC